MTTVEIYDITFLNNRNIILMVSIKKERPFITQLSLLLFFKL